jgi:hypothetical protein
MTKTKTKPKLSVAERAELIALKDKRLHTYVGSNVVRHWFTSKDDAERFLALIIKDGADKPVFYGGTCEFSVTPGKYGDKNCWEVAEG